MSPDGRLYAPAASSAATSASWGMYPADTRLAPASRSACTNGAAQRFSYNITAAAEFGSMALAASLRSDSSNSPDDTPANRPKSNWPSASMSDSSITASDPSSARMTNRRSRTRTRPRSTRSRSSRNAFPVYLLPEYSTIRYPIGPSTSSSLLGATVLHLLVPLGTFAQSGSLCAHYIRRFRLSFATKESRLQARTLGY